MPKELTNWDVEEMSGVDKMGNKEARFLILKQQGRTRIDDGQEFVADDYAYVPDEAKPETWKMRMVAKTGAGPDGPLLEEALKGMDKVPEADRKMVAGRMKRCWRGGNPGVSDDRMPEALRGMQDDSEVVRKEQGAMLNRERVGLFTRLGRYLGIPLFRGDNAGEIVIKTDGKEADMADNASGTKAAAPADTSVEKRLSELEKAGRDQQTEITRLQTENKALQEKVQKSEALGVFRQGLDEPVRKAFDAMSPEIQGRFMAGFSKGQTTDDPVTKALGDMAKANKSLEEKVQKMEAANQRLAYVAKMEDIRGKVENFDLTVDAYSKLAAVDQGSADQMLADVRKSVAQAEKAGLFKVLGKDGGHGTAATAESRIEKAAAKVKEANPGLTQEQAVAKALELDKTLYNDYAKGA